MAKKDEREPIAWVTRGGKHIPIFADEPSEDEKKKERQINENKKQADSLNGKESKEKKIAELKKKMEETKGFFAKNDIKNEIEMLEADWKGTKEEWKAKKAEEWKAQEEKKQQLMREQKEAKEKAEKAKEEEKKKALENELKTQPKEKVEQFKIIQEYNPMHDDYHTGIRKPSDIKTWKEAVESAEEDGTFTWGDFSEKDAKKALKEGKITIYSSYPIKQGVFVSTSKAQSEEYAGGKGNKVYSMQVPLEDVAWINGDEGQFAQIKRRK